MSHNNRISLILIFLVCSGLGCKSSTSPSSSANPSGTLVFGYGISGVAEAVLGSNASTHLFTGDDPTFISGGRILYSVGGLYTANGSEHIVASAPDGTNAQILLDTKANIDDEPSHAKMSPDGKYITINYSNFAEQLGTHFGTLVFSSSGAQLGYIENLWDASWAPDGSLVLSGTVTPNSLINWTPATQGLYKVDKNFSSVTQIGTGLTTPQLPSVSPAGTKISFEMNSHIWVIGMDGSGLKQVTSGSNTESYSCWSPDGSDIATVSYGTFGLYAGNGMAIVSANASSPTALSQSASVWVADNGNNLLQPLGNVDWK